MDEDFHMALCVIKVLALVVIASSLLSISNSLSRGMATDGVTGQGVNAAWVPGEPNAAFLGASAAGYGSVNSQAILGGFANYEPPVFYNVGDVSAYTPEALASIKSPPPLKGPFVSGETMNRVVEASRGTMEPLRIQSIYG